MPCIRPTEAAREHAHAPQSQLVRQEGPGRLLPPLVDQGGGLQRADVRRPPGDRHRQLLVRADQLQRPPAAGGGSGQARGALGGPPSPPAFRPTPLARTAHTPPPPPAPPP